ncbi:MULTISPECIES: hypothetical protein [Enterobacter cloacae complex]|uniref:hypothetical protein n=1 Tax=Enterobacter cloacae complex TaxID=354276 RepID=UPI00097C953C|nr:hypothetical protein [Enterobacter chengduensis]GJL40629.1 hypothetical protein TUM17577_18380 [Enterobacter asburiae]MBT1932382.1 hypothetical protein [Enterobacter chengduensis]MBT1961004.1 hypothetical protein [Enterobacter chengduensis]MCK7170600.1 hypothetical protein [Enterobacter chengduensis]MCM7673322.1 hypothetical protein [Enterobacter chengduensis]
MKKLMLYKVRIFKDDEYVTEITTVELLDTAHENIDVFLKAVRDALEDRGLLTVEHRDPIIDLLDFGAVGFICEYAGGLEGKEFSLALPTSYRG